MNILTIVAALILLLSAAAGWHAGMIKRLNRLVSVFLAAFLVSLFLPYVVSFIRTETQVDEFLEDRCRQVIEQVISDNVPKAAIDRNTVKYLMDQYGMDSSVVDQLTDSQLFSYAQAYFPELLPETGTSVLSNLTRIQQTELIRDLPIPSFLQDIMLSGNNQEGYREFQASDFADYLVRFLCNAILHVLAFAVTTLVVWLILWGIFAGLDLFARLPLLRSVNKAGGLVLGFISGLLIVWVLSLAIVLLSGTAPGMVLLQMMKDSPLLQIINEGNVFLRLISGGLA